MRPRLLVPCLAAALFLPGLLGGTAQAETLAITHPTPGGGTVTSSPAGIGCETFFCSADFAAGSAVTLTATPHKGFAFAGFSEDCTGPICTLTMDGPRAVTVDFVRFAVLTHSKLRRIRATGTAIVTIRVGGAGTLVLSGGRVERQVVSISTASNLKLPIEANGAAARDLRKSGDAKVGFKVAFRPTEGTRTSLSGRARLHLNLAQFEL